MPCLIALLALLTPRLVIVLLALFSTYLTDAYNTVIWPLLGFFFMPFLTLGYAAAVNEGGGVKGLWLAVVIIAVLMDLSGGPAATHQTVVYRRSRRV